MTRASETRKTPARRETMDAAKIAEISRRILAKKAEGMSIKEAFAAVLGQDKLELLIDSLYHELRQKAAA
jgi:hypothetical protein